MILKRTPILSMSFWITMIDFSMCNVDITLCQ
jgi:hypothetical protein